jgi:hypothetical protein
MLLGGPIKATQTGCEFLLMRSNPLLQVRTLG